MPLEPTASAAPDFTPRRLARPRLAGFAAAGVGITLLASCAQGTRREAERGRERDAERTSVMDAMQATESARLLSGTPESTPTPDE